MGNPLPPGRTPLPREGPRQGLSPLGTVAVLATIYFIVAKLGLKLAFFHVSATPVWPPTGITLAAFLVLGLRVWPGVLAGAFLANMTTAGSAFTSLGIATGNTLEGVVGAWLVRRLAGGRQAFERPQDVFKFAALAGLASTTVSATFGVTSLSLGGYAPWANYRSIWLTWWLGDMGGDLVVAPLLLLWGTKARLRWDRGRALEAALLLASLVLVGLVIFADLLPSGMRNYPVEFISLPLLLWAAFRFEQREAATAIAVLSGIAIWGALRGFGPFVRESPNQTLLLLQAFMGITGVTTLAVAAGVSERRRAEEALRSSEQRYRLLFERNLAGVYRATLDGRLLECNEALARILGYSSRDEVFAHSAWDLFFNREDREASLARLKEKGSLTNFEVRIRRRDGTSAWALENETLIPGKDGADLVEGTLIDITERKLAEERIEFHAYHDPLTGLPNRMFLKDRLRLALAQARRSGRGFAVVWLDLDHFKEINDTLGHGVGDRILQDVAVRLRDCVRGEDAVARLGGDEFLLLLASVRHKEEAAHVAKKILGRMGEPFRVDGHELHLTTSAGIALFPQDGKDAGTLLKNADGAMYRAKELGRNAYQLYDPAAQRHTLERLDLHNRLRVALEHEEMALFYQPQVELTTGRIVAAEALLRWLHPEKGLLLPGAFLPLAEDTGLIVPLGEWVLRKACSDARAWQQRGLPPVRISVNLSVREVQQSNLRRILEGILDETGLARRRLELEISESAVRQNFDVTVPVLRDLVGLGIGISIDDFGARLSLPGYLKGLPIRRLKIDRSLVTGIGREPRDTDAVRQIIQIAHSLGHRVVAEGVETQIQLDVLGELECDEIQGWVFSEALPEEALGRLLAASNPFTGQTDEGPGR